ncbi:pentapeptide repeat-containing protein [Kingella oralis]
METQEKMNKSEMGKKECVKRIQEYAKDAYQWLMAGNREQVVLKIAVIELAFLVIVFLLISFFGNWEYEFFKIHGVSTLIALLVSAPIAFAIWHFRDANTQQQIANQRKDVNLKEFQKIAEWVSGAHLVEEELTEKTKTISKRAEQESSTEQETAREYSRQPENQNIPTFSKQDGAIGLQIAAVYMLLPFYRGDHGEDFRRPAFNLLTAAWLSLFSKVDDIETGQELAKQPLAVAITEVLFAEGGLVYSTEAKYEHLLVNLYLPFVNLNMSGLSEKASKVFVGKNCQGIDLHGALLREAHFEGANLEGAHFEEANLMLAHFEKSGLEVTNLRNAHFEGANLRKAHFEGANLVLAHFEKSNLKVTDLRNAYFEGAILADAHFKEANLNGANLNRVNFLKWAHFEGADLFGAQLTESDCKQLPSSISQTQRYDLIVLSLVESPSVQVYQLTATKKIRNRRGDGIEHKIFGCQLNEQKTKELNQANWDIKIKELPPTSQQP